MPDNEPLPAIWLPATALPPPAPPSLEYCKAARLGKASLWAAGTGVACWLGTVTALTLLANLHQAVSNADAFAHTAYFAGLACEFAGIGLGLFAKSAKIGRGSLFLSVGILCAMAAFTLAVHYAFSDSHGNGGWIWDPNEGDTENCGCDNFL